MDDDSTFVIAHLNEFDFLMNKLYVWMYGR